MLVRAARRRFDVADNHPGITPSMRSRTDTRHVFLLSPAPAAMALDLAAFDDELAATCPDTHAVSAEVEPRGRASVRVSTAHGLGSDEVTRQRDAAAQALRRTFGEEVSVVYVGCLVRPPSIRATPAAGSLPCRTP